MDAQRHSVAAFLKSQNGSANEVLAEFAEVESGKRKQRPELNKALALCEAEGATLLIAKLDRLARNAYFLLGLLDRGVDVRFADMPNADKFTIQILACVAEKEATDISNRTKAGLAAAKRRGIKFGNPNIASAVKCSAEANQRRAEANARELAPVIDRIKTKGRVVTLRGIAACLNRRGFKTPNGKEFFPQTVKNLLARIAAIVPAETAQTHVPANKARPKGNGGIRQGKYGANTRQFLIAQKG